MRRLVLALLALVFAGPAFGQGGIGGGIYDGPLSSAQIATALGYTPANCTAGTSANNCLKLNGSAQIPAVDAHLVTGLTLSQIGSLGTGVATALGNTAGGTGGFALQSSLASYLPLAGGTMTGALLTNNYIQGTQSGNRIYPDYSNNQIEIFVGTTGFVIDISADAQAWFRTRAGNADASIKGAAGIFSTTVKTGLYTVSSGTGNPALPSASTSGAGARAYVTDAVACTFLSTLTGGGSTGCPVTSNGTAWVGG